MANSRQRRDAERRRQEKIRQREVRRKRATVVAAVVATLAVIGAVVIVVLANRGGNEPAADSSTTSGAGSGAGASPSASTSTSASPAACGTEQFPTEQVRAARGATITSDGVSVKGAEDLGGKPGITTKFTKTPTKLLYRDLVVGKGQAAGPTSCVTVQYDGVLYKNGKEFDSSWSRGMLAQFPLTGVVPGFTQGIGGTTGVPPMKVGGRRVVILPAALGYGAQGSPPTIPANAPLVFVIDLTKVTAG